MKLTQERLKEVLHYNPATGIFTNRLARSNVKVGSIAGGRRGDGYILIQIDGIQYYAHILAWLYVHGECPVGDIDHEDTDPSNCRINNLRDTSHQGNTQTRRKANKGNSTGLLGVSLFKRDGKYVAQISIRGKNTYLGLFNTPEEAHEAYLTAKRIHHSTCTI